LKTLSQARVTSGKFLAIVCEKPQHKSEKHSAKLAQCTRFNKEMT